MRAGAARTSITPVRGTYLAGYGHPLRGCRSIRDNLSATALVLDDGNMRLAIVSVDALSIHETVTARVRAEASTMTGIAPDAILIACSHSHSSPTASTSPHASDAQDRWVEMFVARTVDAISTAARQTRPAFLERACGRCVVGVNRRVVEDGKAVFGENRDGPVDPSVSLLRVFREDGVPIANVLGFACHPVILPPSNRRASAEWPGAARRLLEEELGGLTLFLQGATGDVNPKHEWGDDDDAAVDRVGRDVAFAALDAARSSVRLAPGPLGCRVEEVSLPLQVARDDKNRPLGYAGALAKQLRLPAFTADPLMNRMYPWIPRAQESGGEWSVPMETQVLRVGEVAIATHASETFTETGLDVKAASPAVMTFFAGYANGMVGYVPTATAHTLGGYEVEPACYFYRYPGPFHPTAERNAAKATVRLMHLVWTRL